MPNFQALRINNINKSTSSNFIAKLSEKKYNQLYNMTIRRVWTEKMYFGVFGWF